MPAAEIILTGDELVRGLTRDANGAWIAARLSAHGIAIRRLTLLPDDVDAVAEELGSALRRAPSIIVVTGGLGPTADDRTLESVSAATGLARRPDKSALALVADRYRELAAAGRLENAELTPERAKMAVLPVGADLLPNAVGTAPGIVLRREGTIVVCLPGVPAEMQAMWESSIPLVLGEISHRSGYAETTFRARTNDESVLAPHLKAVVARHPDVYVKSRARDFGREGVRITIVASGGDAEDARSRAEAAAADLDRLLPGGLEPISPSGEGSPGPGGSAVSPDRGAPSPDVT